MKTRLLLTLLSETDKRALAIAIVIAIVLFLLLGLIGIAVRRTMIYQAKRADSMMYDVARTHAVNSTAEFRRLARKKNARGYFKDSLPPFLIAITGLLVYLIANLATGRWGHNMFVSFAELFPAYDWKAEGVWANVFGLSILASWPPLSRQASFVIGHLGDYIEAILFMASMAYFLYCSQAFLSRAVMLHFRSVKVYEKSLEGYNANEDLLGNLKIDSDKPVPPSD